MKKSRVDVKETKENIYSAEVLLFDFDGTIVNLDKLNVDSFTYVFKNMFNLDFTKDDFMKYISGRSSERGLREYLKLKGIEDFNSKELNNAFDTHKRGLIKEKIDNEIYLSPGIKEFLEHYKEKRMIVVTSSKEEYVKHILEYFDVYKYFESVFDRYDVIRVKPSPEPYEKAMHYADVSVEKCVCFEDSFYGLQSSKGAGLFTIGVLNNGWNDDFVYELADFVISDFQDLIS